MRGEPGARAYVAAAVAMVAVALAPAAHAAHQPGDFVADVFEVDVNATGQLFGTVNDASGGTWTIQTAPHWRVLYPKVVVPTLEKDKTVPTPEPDFDRYAGSAGLVTWAGTTELNGMAPVEQFSCTGELSGPQQIGSNPQYKPQVHVSGDSARFELPTLNGIALLGSGSCSPGHAGAFTPWGIEARNFMEAFFTVPRENIAEDESFRLPVADGPSNSLGPCTVYSGGNCTVGFDWTADVELTKVCRGFAGTATTASAGGFSSVAPFCESECSDATCAAEDFELQPPNKALKERGGAVQIPAACYGDSHCRGQMTLGGGKGFGRAKVGRGQSFGSARFKVKPDNHAKVRVELSAAAMKLLKQTGFLAVAVKSKLKGDEDEIADKSDKETQTIQG